MIKNPVVPVFVALLGLFTLWFSLESVYPRDFIGSVLPELIGFCLEGIFFVGIFSWMQEKKEIEKKTELRKSLAGAVGFICQIINSSIEQAHQIQLPGSDNWTRQARENGRQIRNLQKNLEMHGLNVSEDGAQAIKQLLNSRLSTLDSLLSVSAQLSHSHLSAYTMILTEAHKIGKHHHYGDQDELGKSFSNLLRLLISFNNEAV
jgi:hypothetical protein